MSEQLDRIENWFKLLVDRTMQPSGFIASPGAMGAPCTCEERTVLAEGDGGSMVAWEAWCPTHGYQTSCYRCNDEEAYNTESCRRHAVARPTVKMHDPRSMFGQSNILEAEDSEKEKG